MIRWKDREIEPDHFRDGETPEVLKDLQPSLPASEFLMIFALFFFFKGFVLKKLHLLKRFFVFITCFGSTWEVCGVLAQLDPPFALRQSIQFKSVGFSYPPQPNRPDKLVLDRCRRVNRWLELVGVGFCLGKNMGGWKGKAEKPWF